MTYKKSPDSEIKKYAGIFVDSRSIELKWANELKMNEYSVINYSSNQDLFKHILEQKLNLIVIDSAISSESTYMISNYLLVCPELIIIVLGEDEKKFASYIEFTQKLRSPQSNND